MPEEKICPECGEIMESFDHDDSDGNFAGWGYGCKCGYVDNPDED